MCIRGQSWIKNIVNKLKIYIYIFVRGQQEDSSPIYPYIVNIISLSTSVYLTPLLYLSFICNICLFINKLLTTYYLMRTDYYFVRTVFIICEPRVVFRAHGLSFHVHSSLFRAQFIFSNAWIIISFTWISISCARIIILRGQ